jgi:hypothetical protein
MNDEWRNGGRKPDRMNRLSQLTDRQVEAKDKGSEPRLNQVTDFSEWQMQPVNWLA